MIEIHIEKYGKALSDYEAPGAYKCSEECSEELRKEREHQDFLERQSREIKEWTAILNKAQEMISEFQKAKNTSDLQKVSSYKGIRGERNRMIYFKPT